MDSNTSLAPAPEAAGEGRRAHRKGTSTVLPAFQPSKLRRRHLAQVQGHSFSMRRPPPNFLQGKVPSGCGGVGVLRYQGLRSVPGALDFNYLYMENRLSEDKEREWEGSSEDSD